MFRDRAISLAISIGLVAIIVFLFFPIVTTAIISFDSRGYLALPPPPSFSLRWYETFFNTPVFVQGLETSLVIGSLATVVSTLVGILTAVASVRYNFPGKEILRTLYLSPLTVPGIIIGFSLLGFYSMVGISSSFERLLIAHIIITMPYAIRTIGATLFGFDESLEEAAMNLGADPVQAFYRVVLPVIKPGIIAAAVFSFAMSLDDVAVSVFLVSPTNTTLAVALFAYMKAQFDPTVAAASMVLMAFTMLFILIIEKYLGLDKFVGIGTYGAK